jgi:hypothetical protein
MNRKSRTASIAGVLLAQAAFVLPPALPAQADSSAQPVLLRLPFNLWQIHIGDDPRCASAHDPECNQEKYVVDVNRYGIEWQRIEATLPPSMQQPDSKIGILIQGEEPVYQVFVNGHLIGGSGSFETHEGPLDSRKIFNIPAGLAADGHLVIAIRELNLHNYLGFEDLAPTIAPIQVLPGVMDEDTLAYLRSGWQHYFFFAAMGCTGPFFLLLFAINTKLREYFWLGALLTLLFLFRIAELSSVINSQIPSEFDYAIYNIGNGIQTLIVVEFVFSFLGRPVPRFFRFVEFCGSLSLLNLILLVPTFCNALMPMLHIIEPVILHSFGGAIFCAVLAQLLLLPMCFRSKLPEMRWIGGATLFLTVVEARWQAGWALSLGFPEYIHLGALDLDLRPVAWMLFASVMLIAMTFRLRRIQERNRDIEQELAAARSIQQILIPDQLPSIPGLLIESAYLPAQEVGGDFFQILPIPNSTDTAHPFAFIVLGDVSGKGLKAAMTVSMIVGTLRASASHCSGPAELLAEVNSSLVGRSDGFATCLALMVEPPGKITLANAGHPNPYLSGVEIHTEGNLPLGLAEKIDYSEIALQLPPEQTCTLITDGVVEATSATTHELFGFDRTQAISSQSASAIAEAARAFGVGAPQADDITVLTVARAGVLPAVLA